MTNQLLCDERPARPRTIRRAPDGAVHMVGHEENILRDRHLHIAERHDLLGAKFVLGMDIDEAARAARRYLTCRNGRTRRSAWRFGRRAHHGFNFCGVLRSPRLEGRSEHHQDRARRMDRTYRQQRSRCRDMSAGCSRIEAHAARLGLRSSVSDPAGASSYLGASIRAGG